mgnify:CR=1 FL=1
MKYIGEGNAYRRSKKLSGAYQKQEPCTDTTLESPLNGRRRCKDVNIYILISQASGRSKTTMIVKLSGPLTNRSIR